jgi:formiminotetrahydrofolate cyclodeaminase
MLVDQPVRDVLAAFSSSEPVLLLMVAALPKTRSGSDDDRSALASATKALTGIRQQLTDAVDADASAYDQVVAAYRLPKAPGDEQDARKAAIQGALRAATEVPLGVLRLSEAALDQAKTIAARGNRAAASDVGVAVALLRAGARGARLNIEINIGSIADAAYADAVRAETIGWSDAAGQTADQADALLRGA